MNGKDVAPGESVSLTCGCFIEVDIPAFPSYQEQVHKL